MSYSVLLFDLDGTLTNPKLGITQSIQYALSKLHIDEPDLDRLETFIGPPLKEAFQAFYKLSEADAIRAIAHYRERFERSGIFENALYTEIPGLLESLVNNHFKLAVATSKPTVYAKRILAHFKIEHYFSVVEGSYLDGRRSAKADVIEAALNKFPQFEKYDFVMIGDRKHDIEGARRMGIDSIGVTYGFGSETEIATAHPTYYVHTIEQLQCLIMNSSL
jgi:phosphoglycolate phosphatase